MKLTDDENTSTEFNDLCDNVIDFILCHLQLEDLANIADTNTRLRSIAGSIFSRKHSHRLISIDTLYYAMEEEYNIESQIKYWPFYCKHEAFVRFSDAKIWFKLIRNFGAYIKFIRIQGIFEICTSGTYILDAIQNVMKYVSEFCSESLNVLEVVNYPFFTLHKPMTNLQEFIFMVETLPFYSEKLKLMPNLRSLRLFSVPRILKKRYEKLEDVSLVIENDDEVHPFISFLRMNRHIKHLRVAIGEYFGPEHNDLVFSSIAENLTQLKTLKIVEWNKPTVFSTHHFKTVESFSFERNRNPRDFTFEFTNLRKFTLKEGDDKSSDWLNCILRNKGLKTLKLCSIPNSWLIQSIIQNLLSGLPELEQIIVNLYEKEHISMLEVILGREWKQCEEKETGRFKTPSDLHAHYKRFQKNFDKI